MANLAYWRGNNEFDRFRREMDRLFEGFFGNVTPFNAYGNTFSANNAAKTGEAATVWYPTCELVETDKTYVIKADLPGVSDKDVDVQVAANQLTIKGERKWEWDEAKGTHHFSERNYGTFARSFSLPATVDSSKIRARFDRGVLEIEMPKTTAGTLTKVKVEQK